MLFKKSIVTRLKDLSKNIANVEVQNKNYHENVISVELYTCIILQWLCTGFFVSDMGLKYNMLLLFTFEGRYHVIFKDYFSLK